jgi:hypothetical protein
MPPAIREGKVEMTETAHAEGVRAGLQLSAWLHRNKRNINEVEKSLGWTHKTLYNAINGRTPLRFSHVAAVLEVIGEDLGAFYRELAKGAPPKFSDDASTEAAPPSPALAEIAPGLTEAQVLERARQVVSWLERKTEDTEE